MKNSLQTTFASVSVLILTTVSALAQAPNEAGQALSLRLASPKPALTVSPGTNAGSLTILWDANAVGFLLQSRPAFGPGNGWSAVTPQPITGAGSAAFPTTAAAVQFYQLNGPRGVGPRIASQSSSDGRVDVPILEAGDKVPATSLTVLIEPESAMILTNHPVTFAALVDGYTNGESLSFKWELNQTPYTTNLVTTNSTWRDFNVGSNTNFVTVPGNPDTNVFTIASVTTNDVAYYRVTVTAVGTNGTNIASSAAAPLWVWQPTNSIIVAGTPVQLLGGSATACPGPFSYTVPFPGVYPDPPANPASPVNVFDDLTFPNTSIYWTTLSGRYADKSCGTGHAQITYASKAATLPWYFTVYVPASDATPPTHYYVYMNFH